MTDEIQTILQSLHRSRVRLGVLLELETRGAAPLGQLERALGVRSDHLKAALLGGPPAYSIEGSLIGLGLATEVRGMRGTRYEITRLGERAARYAREDATEARRGRRRLWTELARMRGL